MSSPRTVDAPDRRPGPGHPAGASARGMSARLAVRSCAHPDTGPSRASTTAAEVRELHAALAARPSLVPGPGTDELFGRLVSLAIDPEAARDAEAVLADPLVAPILPGLRRLCADGEFELERSWARRVIGHPDPRAELARFPYHRNYRDLTRLEHHAVAGLTDRPPRRVLFIGSGPLPLTSLLLAEHHGCRVDNLDVEPAATALGEELAAALGAPGLTFRTGDVLDDPTSTTTTSATTTSATTTWSTSPRSPVSTPTPRPACSTTWAAACDRAPWSSPAAPTPCAACSTPSSTRPTCPAWTRSPSCTRSPTSSTPWSSPASRTDHSREAPEDLAGDLGDGRLPRRVLRVRGCGEDDRENRRVPGRPDDCGSTDGALTGARETRADPGADTRHPGRRAGTRSER